MMTEQFTNAQTLMERDVLPSPKPTTDEIIIRGEDLLVENEEKPATANEIFRELVESQSLEAAKKEFNGWLSLKVKNELVTQIFRDEVQGGTINIEEVASVLRNEIETEKNNQFQSIYTLENVTIPKAELRAMPNFVTDNAYSYWKDDVANLWSRVEVHMQMIEHIESLENNTEDGVYDLSENFIKETRESAYKEAVLILQQQKEELEARSKVDGARIAELEGTIELLSTDLATTKEEVNDRDFQLLDAEADAVVIARLTERAKELAA